MHSHSIARRPSSAFSFDNPFVALPPAARRLSRCLVPKLDDGIDSGADADDEKTPTKKRFRSDPSEEGRVAKKRRTENCGDVEYPCAAGTGKKSIMHRLDAGFRKSEVPFIEW
jgi:hypothetical protein